MSLPCSVRCALIALLVLVPSLVRAENRTIDGSGNHGPTPSRNQAGTVLVRFGYQAEYGNQATSGMWTDTQRGNARTISNTLSAQSTSQPSARGLSDYSWAWAQFLDHDMSLSTSSNGSAVNGSAPIATGGGDPLGPNPIAFTRSNFQTISGREQVNEVTGWIDGSQIYGSSTARAAALRTSGGTGAKLATSANNLLPYNTGGLSNQNNGPTPSSQLFLAGDIRANENLVLTSLQTVFMREHNRLVDRIATMQPSLNAEQQYQLARKIVGAEVQAITYNEYLPALLGANAPQAEDYVYNAQSVATITNSFAHAAFRYGHSALSPTLQLVNSNGSSAGSLAFGQAFFNPNLITNNPAIINQALMGAATQTSQEVDLQLVDAIRNVMFGPPGAGGTDLMAIDIQRGRDHGLPDYNQLRQSYGLPRKATFTQITSDLAVRQAIQSIYVSVDNIDPLVGMLLEEHVAGSSLGPLLHNIITSQFTRSRDGDRLFYRGDDAGLYLNGVLRPEIAAIIDLNGITLADVIEANTGLSALPDNVFFASAVMIADPGDFNRDGSVNGADLVEWKNEFGGNGDSDADFDGDVDGADFLTWQRNVGTGSATVAVASVPEPGSLALALASVMASALWRCSRRRAA